MRFSDSELASHKQQAEEALEEGLAYFRELFASQDAAMEQAAVPAADTGDPTP